VRPLCTRLFKAVREAGLTVELLLLDDDSGQDTLDTQQAALALRKDGYEITVHVRRCSEGTGLSSAVVLGISKARYSTILVMDADLQHEPESVPAVAAPVLRGEAEFSVGSRNVGGGKGFEPGIRSLISSGATMLAVPLTSCSDPMSGFFCVRRDAYARAVTAGLNPMGYKILLELLVRSRCSRVTEVPIIFRDREAGESKLSAKQQVLYLRHLGHLYWFKFPAALVVLLVSCALAGFFALRWLAALLA
jgi:dolichol-phosphate mannosyltransferase